MSHQAKACANFALSKYWGKKSAVIQQPAVPSVSIGIEGLEAEAQVRFSSDLDTDLIFLDDSPADSSTCTKVGAVLDRVRAVAGIKTHAEVRSKSHFPVQAGLASSAAGLAAVSAASWLAAGLDPDRKDEIADCARLGSGSASRSIHGGFVAWEVTPNGSRVRPIAPASHWPLELCLVHISSETKKVPSRAGMKQAQQTSPMWDSWVKKAHEDAQSIEDAILKKDFEELGALAEANCLLMHATTMTARPPVHYLKAESWLVIELVQELREEGVPCFFTADAGPNIKVFAPPGRGQEVQAELTQRLGEEIKISLLHAGGELKWGKE